MTTQPRPKIIGSKKLAGSKLVSSTSNRKWHFFLDRLGKDVNSAKKIDGFTPQQRFFLAFAQVWRGKYTDAAMRQQVLTNPHSPPHWRVVGPERNVDGWYDAFGVKPGDKMYIAPDQRVHLW